MKCPYCGVRQAAKQYGKHITRCRKTQADMYSFVVPAAGPAPSETRLESKAYPIGGVVVRFPYKPYPVQFQYMSKVIIALKNKLHALLESPTGTGKTLSLLCSTLAWQQKVKAEYEREQAMRCPLHDIDSWFPKNDQDNYIPNGASAASSSGYHDTSPSNRSNNFGNHSNEDDSDYRQGKKFGRIASVKIHNPVVKKKKTLERKTRSVHVFIHDVYRNVKVKRVQVKSVQEENTLSLVEIDEATTRCIFVEIPKSGVAMVQKELYVKPNTKHETWVLEKPTNYVPPPLFIDECAGSSTPLKTPSEPTPVKTDGNDNDDNDFVAPKRDNKSPGVVANKADEYDFEKDDPAKREKLEMGEGATATPCLCDEIRQRKRKTAPRIYFCTRTHRQIAQIIRELNKTEFNQVQMTILSSREHSCINPSLAKEPNKNDKCRELRQHRHCQYGLNSSRLVNPRNLVRHGISKAWDVEDLCRVGKRETACPYYASVEMVKTADIVFAPYNYILDPFIASQRELTLTDNVVIFDEGHNIEDVCRSSVGYEATQFQIGEAINNLDEVIKKDRKCFEYNQNNTDIGFESLGSQLIGISTFLKTLLDWTLGFKGRLVDDYFEHAHYSLDGPTCLKQLQAIGITSDRVEQLSGWVTVVMDQDKEKNSDSPPPQLEYTPPKPKSTTIFLCEKFIITYRIFAATGNSSSFSLCIKQCPLSVEDPHTRRFTRISGLTLSISCLNPAVVFKDLSSKCHSVIVTSGTLSPMDTFQSELGTEFKVDHEGKHVVPKSNFLAMNLTAGPSGHSFNAGYKNAETFSFQDDVGEVILRVCSLVPHGVLVFFPSYRLLDKICERWRLTDAWGKIQNHKIIVCEPKGSNRKAFNEAMEEFDENVDEGALLLAVCRGKISEGVDFADNNARAVITIGLPFPNFKSTEITDKRKYNDKFCAELGLLSGQEWYTIQAFRAVNQALGRCLRHINDWGAIIMIESRLATNQKYWRSISRWIRDDMFAVENCSDAFQRLEYFCHDKRGMLDEYDMNGGGFVADQTSSRSLLEEVKTPVKHSTPHSKYPSINLTDSPGLENIPLFSNERALAGVPECSETPSDKDFISSKNKLSPVKCNKVTTPSITIDISSSPELFADVEKDQSEDEVSTRRVEEATPEKIISPQKLTLKTVTSEDKRTHSPEDTVNLVIKRRRVSRMQQHLNESSSENCTSPSSTSDHQTTPTISTASSTTPSPNSPTLCPGCSTKILKTRPSEDKTVKISDFIRGRYDIRALGRVHFVPFPDENATNSTLGNLAVYCVKCGKAIGRVTFSIDDDDVRGMVKLE